MIIGIIATHSFALPNPQCDILSTINTPHTGDIVISGLAKALSELGHTIYIAAPDSSYYPPNGKLLRMRASYGNYPPSSEELEQECWENYKDIFRQCDIVHDFSVSKIISQNLYCEGKKTISTLMGGAWTQDISPHNLCAWTESHRKRILSGQSDFFGTKTPNAADGPTGYPGKPIKEAHTVNGGVDTNFYTPTYDKKDYFVCITRWHEARGFRQAIEIAKTAKIKLIMAGEHPNNERFEYQKKCALQAVKLSEGCSNIEFVWLPKTDPDHHLVKRELFRGAKAFINPIQVCEPFGLSMVEALGTGIPVIATNYGSPNEIIQSGETGFVCDNEINSFIEAISKIDQIDPKKCRDHAVNKFDISVMAKNYLKEYQKIINGENW